MASAEVSLKRKHSDDNQDDSSENEAQLDELLGDFPVNAPSSTALVLSDSNKKVKNEDGNAVIPYVPLHSTPLLQEEYNKVDEDDEHAMAKVSLMYPAQLLHHANALKKAIKQKQPDAVCYFPDEALAVWSILSGSCVSILEHFMAGPKAKRASFDRVQIKPASERVSEKSAETKLNGFINFQLEGNNPTFMPDHLRTPGWGFFTPFGKHGGKYGPTEHLGVNGNVGKVIKDGVVTESNAQYEFCLESKSVMPLMEDHDRMNPVITCCAVALSALLDSIFASYIDKNPDTAFKKAATASRSFLPAECQGKPTGAQVLQSIKDAKKWAGKIHPDKSNPAMWRVSISDSVYRKAQKRFNPETERVEIVEDLTDYKHPSEMFERNKSVRTKKGTEPQLWGELPLFRARRPDEVDWSLSDEEKLKRYPFPFVRVPSDNAVTSWLDCTSMYIKPSGYDDKMEKAGYKLKPQAILWLNSCDALSKITQRNQITPCDPRFCFPMAGYYRGPKGWEGGAPPEQNAIASAAAAADVPADTNYPDA